jgi:hypothetical protein
MKKFLVKWLPFIFCRPTSKSRKCVKCGKRSFKVVFDGGYTRHVECKCCGAKQPGTESFVI